MLRANARVVKAGTDGVGVDDLALIVLCAVMGAREGLGAAVVDNAKRP